MVYDPGKIYRAALIGCGSMGSYCMDELQDATGRILLPYGHAEILKTHPRTRLVAGADPDRGRLEDFGKRWEVDALYSDHREMLEAERPQIVAIASPPDFHASQVEDCARSGVQGIFCEKPFTTNLALADRMIASCRESGTRLAVNHTRRGDPLILRTRRLLDEGGIGEVLSIVATWPGRLFLSGTHWFDLVNYLAGDSPPSWIVGHSEDPEASMVAIPTQRGQDLGGTTYAVYPNGIRAFFNGRDSHPGYRVEVNGTRGVLSIETTAVRLWKTNPGSVFRELLEHPFPQMMRHTAPMVYLLEDLLAAVEQGGEPLSNGTTARNALELILATHDSSRRGNVKVRLPLEDREMRPPFQWQNPDGSTFYSTTAGDGSPRPDDS
jgi:predicted dehydrogenase